MIHSWSQTERFPCTVVFFTTFYNDGWPYYIFQLDCSTPALHLRRKGNKWPPYLLIWGRTLQRNECWIHVIMLRITCWVFILYWGGRVIRQESHEALKDHACWAHITAAFKMKALPFANQWASLCVMQFWGKSDWLEDTRKLTVRLLGATRSESYSMLVIWYNSTWAGCLNGLQNTLQKIASDLIDWCL